MPTVGRGEVRLVALLRAPGSVALESYIVNQELSKREVNAYYPTASKKGTSPYRLLQKSFFRSRYF